MKTKKLPAEKCEYLCHSGLNPASGKKQTNKQQQKTPPKKTNKQKNKNPKHTHKQTNKQKNKQTNKKENTFSVVYSKKHWYEIVWRYEQFLSVFVAGLILFVSFGPFFFLYIISMYVTFVLA